MIPEPREITLQPMVKTKIKVQMNSTVYFFMTLSSLCGDNERAQVDEAMVLKKPIGNWPP